ncbi:MAG: Ig-like domain-containing protein [Gemmatimonadota bacterium]
MTIRPSLRLRVATRVRIARVAAGCLALLSGCAESTATAPPEPVIAVAGIDFRADFPATVLVAETRPLTVLGQTRAGDVVLAAGVSWESSDPAIASIDSVGTLTVNGVGQVAVTARYREFSATRLLVASPAFVGVQLVEQPLVIADSGTVFVVSAQFLDVNDKEVSVPWPINWAVKQGAESLQFQILDAPRNTRIRMQAYRAGDITVQMTANGQVVSQQFAAWVDAAPFTVERFDMVQGGGVNNWLYMPDLHIRSHVDDLIVRRVEFRNAAPFAAACGHAALVADAAATPIFDFQPYNFSWQGQRVADGTTAEVTIIAEHAGRRFQVSATGRYATRSPTSIVDYGTPGFIWRACA